MKKFIVILFLILTCQFTSQADDIRDFQIEGMSVGESLLDYISEKEIKKKMRAKNAFWYPKEAFVSIGIILETFKTYEDVGVVFKPDDSNYTIHALEGSLYFEKNINECHEKQKIIGKDLENLFENKEVKIERWDADYIGDKTGESKVRYIDFVFNDGSASRVICYDMSEKYHALNDEDTLYTVVNSKEFMKYLDKNM